MVTVRPAEPADLPLLAGIEDAADGLFAQRFGGVDWPPPTPGEARAAEPGFLLVAVGDAAAPARDAASPTGGDTVLGFAHVLDLGTGRWHLDQIAVDPAHSRRGAGAALLAALHEEVARRGGRQVTLMTYADVPWNGPWYARHGYAVLDPPPEHLWRFRETEERLGLGRYGRRVAMARHLSAPRGA